MRDRAGLAIGGHAGRRPLAIAVVAFSGSMAIPYSCRAAPANAAVTPAPATPPAAVDAGAGAGVRPADPITAWSTIASSAAAQAGMSPLRQPLTLALVHLAMHDAVAVATRAFAPYTRSPPRDRGAAPAAAVAEAAYTILRAVVPAARAALDDARRQALAASDGDPVARDLGVAAGRAVAEKLLAARAHDGRDATPSFVPRSGPGQWIATPPAHLPAAGTFLARVTPFTLPRPSAVRPPGPPPLASRRYADDFDEVKRLGARTSTARTPSQTATALFWEPIAGTVWPISIHRVAEEQGLDLARSARFQAAAFVAFADAMIACWDAKMAYHWWRPITAIAAAADDGNAATEPDASWEPLAVTPNFPEYPSGHACISAAVSEVIEGFFEGFSERPSVAPVPIRARNVKTGEERRYGSAKEIVDEVIEARMLLGVHFRAANQDGARIGHDVARAVLHRLVGQAARAPASRPTVAP